MNHGFAQTPSVLSSGNWYKFSVTQDGVVKIDYNLLRTAGINPDQINPKKIKIFSGSYGMLPQSNSLPRKKDLTEIPVFIVAEYYDVEFMSKAYTLEKPIIGIDVKYLDTHFQN